ncbi:MAG: hypothetical protein KNU04_gp70 [crAssphage sp. isolate ctbg_1]|uniref:Uncharacterized protein n=1 Tax=crAssphage sp. isolate ctbg_1 TaxID=2989854 RepID=A0A345MT42_9CAUD|nr:MAG: hypothetical protein KNU04_gp70 [crAssphage sp. isolate ctbg_1]AXH74542.1 MAG: hypothetical protein [crAssphage sp. isolate ctbg_1]
MSKKNYNEYDVIRILRRTGGIKIDESTKTITVLINTPKIGNSTYGKIDYLTNYCGYTVLYTSEIKIVRNNNDDYKIRHNKRLKVNMADMVKDAMKSIK